MERKVQVMGRVVALIPVCVVIKRFKTSVWMLWVSRITFHVPRLEPLLHPLHASRALCLAKRAPRAAFPSACLAAQTKRWAEGIKIGRAHV